MWILDVFRISYRVKKLEESLSALESLVKAAQLDWDELYDRMRRTLGRVEKSRAIVQKAEQSAAHEATEPDPSAGNGRLPQGGLLSDRQKQIQQQILRRRAGGI